MSKVTWATQFQKQDVLRTLTVGFQPYLPFSQQYGMSLRQRGEPGYFELTPQPIYGDTMLPTTGKGSNYSFRTRMETYMGQGEGKLAYMSRNTTGTGDRGTQVANKPPVGAGTEAGEAGRRLAKIFDNKGAMDSLVATTGAKDVGELTLGNLTARLDKELKMTSKQKELDRGVQRGGKFWGNDFDLKLEQTGGTFREFLNTKIGKKEMKGVHSVEMTRAAGNSAASKLLSMNAKDMNARSEKGAEAKFKAHVTEKLTTINKEIKDIVTRAAYSDLGAREEYDRIYGKVSSVAGGGSGMLAARALVEAGSDVLLNRTMRDFIGKVSRGTLINELNDITGISKHLYQVRLGAKMLGFTMISAKPRKVGDLTYPRFEPEPHTIVMEVASGPNQLVNALGEWAVEHKGIEADVMSEMIASSESYASSLAVLTEDRLAHKSHVAMVDAAEMVSNSVGLVVGDKVQSNIRLTHTDIAENIRQQMIKHFTKGGASRKFKQWYDKLFNDSNLLTKAWYRDMPLEGKGTDNKRASFSEEWTYGDDKGNPNKRYLGVWSKASQDTWKNDVGRNVSISPFIISRRKGVAAFRTGGDYGKD